MMYFIHSIGIKKAYYESVIDYFNSQLNINNDRLNAFEFAQASFIQDFGFPLFKQIDSFLSEVIEIEDEPNVK